MFCFASGSSISYFIIFFFHPNLLLPPSPEEKETTPWKTNIEHNHEGLVQIVFLSFIVWWLSVPAVNLPGCSPNCSSGFFQTQAICVPFWALIKTFFDNSMTVVGFTGLYVRNPLSSRITIPISINWVVSSVSSAKKNSATTPPRWSGFLAPGCLVFSSTFQWNIWGADITSFSIIASGHAAGIPDFTDIKNRRWLSFLKLKFMAFWGGVFPNKPTILPRSSEHTGNGGNYTIPQNWETWTHFQEFFGDVINMILHKTRYTTLRKGKSSTQQCFGRVYVSSQEGILPYSWFKNGWLPIATFQMHSYSTESWLWAKEYEVGPYQILVTLVK